MARFVVKENHIHHVSDCYHEESFIAEIKSLYEEDLALFDNSKIFIAKERSTIVGSVKVTLWDENQTLPIEKLFNIKIKNILPIGENMHIWHVGRFAITKEHGLLLLKELLVRAISLICDDADSIMVAECDAKFVRVLNLMGIQTKALAGPIYYLGSETIPIYATNEWLSNFLNQIAV